MKMNREELKHLYNCSTDYKRLLELVMDGNEIVCFATHDFGRNSNHLIVTDVCTMKYQECKSDKRFSEVCCGCRGYVFMNHYPFDEGLRDIDFEYDCKSLQIMFIDPYENNKE